MLNVITAKFCSGSTQTWTDEAYQWDYGQVLQFDGLDLPDAYQVHFSNTPLTGETITQIGGADGVTVPDQCFTTGETIYAWVYLHEGEDDGETVYMVTIPVKKRPQPSDDVPTPVEQSAIDQAIAALNIAVEKAEDAIEHYPTIIDGTWHVWDVTEEEYVDTGVEAQGEPGDPGDPGQDGFSPEVTVTDITGGHRVTITDAEGTQSFDVMDGSGAPGYFGICESTYSATTKIVPCEGFELVEGARIIVRFTAPEDASISSGHIKLNVNNTGAKSVKYKNATGGMSTVGKTFCDYRTYEFVYDGTYYIVVGDFDTNTTYLNLTKSAIDTGTDVTGRLISAKVLHDALADVDITVDDELSTTSTNPVQNKVITEELNSTKADLSELSSSIAPVESSATATAAHAVGELFMMGETLMVALSAIAIGDTITTDGGSPNAAVTKLSDKLIKDVKINGSSILNNGVANVPIADSSSLGVMKVNPDNGLRILSGGTLAVYQASDTNIKNATNDFRPIVAKNQHSAAFYGLAKVAGDSTQSASSNPVGTYTDDAKAAIRNMLGSAASDEVNQIQNAILYTFFDLGNLDYYINASGQVTYRADSGWGYTESYYPVSPSTTYYFKTNNGIFATEYDSNKNFIKTTPVTLPAGKLTTSATTAYIRISAKQVDWITLVMSTTAFLGNYDISSLNTAIDRKLGTTIKGNLYGKKIVFFGDSITGNYAPPADYPSILAQATGATVYNAGFGGTCMSDNGETIGLFSFCRLIDAIVDNDWTDQDNSGFVRNYIGDSENYVPAKLAMLKAIVWSEIDYVVTMHGTNDWGKGYTLDNSNNLYDTTTYAGAFRYAFERLQTAYPNIKIVPIAPLVRMIHEGGVYYDSNEYDKGTGQYLYEFANKIIDVAGNKYQTMACDMYHRCLITKMNWNRYLMDGIHPTTPDGQEWVAELLVAFFNSYI